MALAQGLSLPTAVLLPKTPGQLGPRRFLQSIIFAGYHTVFHKLDASPEAPIRF